MHQEAKGTLCVSQFLTFSAKVWLGMAFFRKLRIDLIRAALSGMHWSWEADTSMTSTEGKAAAWWDETATHTAS